MRLDPVDQAREIELIDGACASLGLAPDSAECMLLKSDDPLSKEALRAYAAAAAGKGAAAVCAAYGAAAASPICDYVGSWLGGVAFDAVEGLFSNGDEEARRREGEAWALWDEAQVLYHAQMSEIRESARAVVRAIWNETLNDGKPNYPVQYCLPAEPWRTSDRYPNGEPVRCNTYSGALSDAEVDALLWSAGGEALWDLTGRTTFAFLAGTRTDPDQARREADANFALLGPYSELMRLAAIQAGTGLAVAHAVVKDWRESRPGGWALLPEEADPPFTALAGGGMTTTAPAPTVGVPKRERSWGRALGLLVTFTAAGCLGAAAAGRV